MNPEKITVEDLLADETFVSYCRGDNAEHRLQWEAFAQKNPGSAATVGLARERYYELFQALAWEDLQEQVSLLSSTLDRSEPSPVIELANHKQNRHNRYFRLFTKTGIAVALLLILIVSTTMWLKNRERSSPVAFRAEKGERKSIQLPDGSLAFINGSSLITLGPGFGRQSRDIYLEGEAFFDVKHNAKLPFIVHTPVMDITAVGTAFDVRAYPDELTTETSLIKGLVEVTIKDEKLNRLSLGKIMLHPNQKVRWPGQMSKAIPNPADTILQEKTKTSPQLIENVTLTNDGEIKETGWTANKLIFENDSMSDIAVLLERWYGVQIDFDNDELRSYRFTGTFEKEELNVVLGFFKESRNFKYEIIPGKIPRVRLYK